MQDFQMKHALSRGVTSVPRVYHCSRVFPPLQRPFSLASSSPPSVNLCVRLVGWRQPYLQGQAVRESVWIMQLT